MRGSLCLVGALGLSILAGVAYGQLGDSSFEQLAHPAIQYSTRPTHDAVAGLSSRIQNGSLQLAFDERHGYLPALLKAMDIPIDSQIAVFSKTSTQLAMISPQNPRAIYFNDSTAVSWLRGGFVLEIATQDPVQGTMFYELDQRRSEKPSFRRTLACLRCHHSLYTNGVPGMLVRSMPTGADGAAMPWTRNLATDHRSPFAERWGGWYVTGRTSGLPHLGNTFSTRAAAPTAEPQPDLETLSGRFDTAAYLSPYSDIVALMVLEHQLHITNLLTRLGWEMRAAAYDRQPAKGARHFSVETAVAEIVDYLLFIDEAPLPGKIAGTSGFAERFTAEGPFDGERRSLRQLDLERRLLKYPCSYMIYSPVFDGLPAQAREAIYARMWQVLSGRDGEQKYARLSESDRLAIVQILHATKKGLPAYFAPWW
ncbi:MAG: hypothetical protein ND807_15890 [Vicinamibacterales bacterium]|nr:hypothetical protein [Vicinamibacterales bacterium]